MGTTIPRFRADRPFLFFIRDLATGSFLFGGSVLKPDEAIIETKPSVTPQLHLGSEFKPEETTEHMRQPLTSREKGNTETRLPTNMQNINGSSKREHQHHSKDKDAIQFTSRTN